MQPPSDLAIDRRTFLQSALIAGGLPLLLTGCAASRRAAPSIALPLDPVAVSPPRYPIPDLSAGNFIECVAGIRPFRTGGVRIEMERLGEKTLIHNYGHGGAGLTLSWGSAAEVLRLMDANVPLFGTPGAIPAPYRPSSIAVLGAGVIGLTTAYELLRAGHTVRIYTKATQSQTTSWLAGGQWAPSLVARGNPQGDSDFFNRVLSKSHERFAALANEGGWGVLHRPNFVADGGGGGGLDHVPAHLIPPAEHHDELPLAGVRIPGRIFRTMLIEPPIFLPRLADEIESLGGETRLRTFASLDDVRELPAPLIINCLGLGARDIVHDPRLVPIRGQLVYMQPQPLPYLLSHERGYVFPRSDALILGGTIERGIDDTTPDESACMRIVERNRGVFGVQDKLAHFVSPLTLRRGTIA